MTQVNLSNTKKVSQNSIDADFCEDLFDILNLLVAQLGGISQGCQKLRFLIKGLLDLQTQNRRPDKFKGLAHPPTPLQSSRAYSPWQRRTNKLTRNVQPYQKLASAAGETNLLHTFQHRDNSTLNFVGENISSLFFISSSTVVANPRIYRPFAACIPRRNPTASIRVPTAASPLAVRRNILQRLNNLA